MYEVISVSYLLAFGILLIGLEVITFSFVLFFLGVGFILTASISSIYEFDSAVVQVAVAFVIALLSALLLRGKMLRMIEKPSEKVEERTHISGVGIVQDGAVKFNGTFWESLDDLSIYEDGQKVEIEDVVDNMVVIKK